MNETLTHLQVNMEEQFGKGKQDLVFHSIITSNGLQIVQRSVVFVANSLSNSQGQSINMRVHE